MLKDLLIAADQVLCNLQVPKKSLTNFSQETNLHEEKLL
jgi:hypothetical protein